MTTKEILEKLRDMAPKLTKGEVDRVKETIMYTPPFKPSGERMEEIHGPSSVITGLHENERSKSPRIEGSTTGEGQNLAAWGDSVGAHKT